MVPLGHVTAVGARVWVAAAVAVAVGVSVGVPVEVGASVGIDVADGEGVLVGPPDGPGPQPEASRQNATMVCANLRFIDSPP